MSATWAVAAQRVFDAHPSVASVSIVSRTWLAAVAPELSEATVVLAATAAWPACFVNPGVADLIGNSRTAPEWPREELQRVIAAATLRGLQHAWVIVDDVGATSVQSLVATPPGDRVVICALEVAGAEGADKPIALGIDASWLLDGESGAQVFVFEMLKAMARLEAIGAIVLLSDSGGVPQSMAGVPRISGRSWIEATASPERLDILHRPYQPGVDTDFARYRQVARTVALTVLDFIAYDNPAYHESPFAFRAYQRAFDARVRDADQVIAISRHVGDRLQRQFAHQLPAPVRSILLGTDHLDRRAARAEAETPAVLAGIASKQYVAILGNDFAHKNRDFGVKIFAEMCERGYAGRLVLAGFHLDAGSSFDDELRGAGVYADRVLRVGRLTADAKTWLLEHAEAILYPTSSEGFGLVPFEAAALGTPTAFVRFGPLKETMPEVPAANGWTVAAFASHVLALIAEPASFVASVNSARAPLTWERCAAETIAAYRQMLQPAASWHVAVAERGGPTQLQRLNDTASELWRRAVARLRRTTRQRLTQEGK